MKPRNWQKQVILQKAFLLIFVWFVIFVVFFAAVILFVVVVTRPAHAATCDKTAPSQYDCASPALRERWNAWERSRERVFLVSAYNSTVEQTDWTPCVSANGVDICSLERSGDHTCAASLPFGTRLSVPGFGVCTVRDRLAWKYRDRIDLYFGGADRIWAARAWGIRRMKITILY